MYQGQIVETGSVMGYFCEAPTSLHQRTAGLPPPAPPAPAPTAHRGGLYGSGARRRWVRPKSKRNPWMRGGVQGLPSAVVPDEMRRPTGIRKNGPLLRVENLQVGYPSGVFGKTRRHVMAVNRMCPLRFSGRNLWPGGGVGLRQNHPGPRPAAAGPSPGGACLVQWPGCLGPAGQSAAASCGAICKSSFKIPLAPSTPA
jgi:hypothetical protein